MKLRFQNRKSKKKLRSMEGKKDGDVASEANLDLDFENMDGLRGDVVDTSRPDNITQCMPEEGASYGGENRTSFAPKISIPTKGDKIPSSEELERRLQQQIDDINSKRKRDTDLLNDFKKALEMQVMNSCSVLEEAIVHSYEEHSQAIEEKLQENFAALERIRQLESELMNFKETLGVLYTDMQNV